MRDWAPDIRTLAILENEQLYNDFQAGMNYTVMPNNAPEDDGGQDIAWGHKLLFGEEYPEGLSIDKCWRLLEQDYIECHLAVLKYLGHGLYTRLPDAVIFLLAELMFNGVFHSFPKYIRALTNRDYKTALKESTRYWTVNGKKLPLTRRNEMTASIIKQLMEEPDDS